MCSGSHGQTAGTCNRPRVKMCGCGERLQKTRVGTIEMHPENPDAMVWYCPSCKKYEYVD